MFKSLKNEYHQFQKHNFSLIRAYIALPDCISILIYFVLRLYHYMICNVTRKNWLLLSNILTLHSLNQRIYSIICKYPYAQLSISFSLSQFFRFFVFFSTLHSSKQRSYSILCKYPYVQLSISISLSLFLDNRYLAHSFLFCVLLSLFNQHLLL